MRTRLLFLVSIITVISAKAQIEFTETTVMDHSLYLGSSLGVFSADLDGDGDKDVLASSYFDDKLVWFENLDGVAGDFAQHTITTSIETPWGVHAADIDADGDMDILSTALFGNHIIWYENTDGNGDFVLKQYISAYRVNTVSTADMDGDGDLDVIWSSSQDGKIKWSRNTDGLGTFANTLNVENNTSSIPGFYVVDVDGDNDLDVVSAYSIQGGAQGLTWYRNETGTGSFSSKIIIDSNLSGVSSMYAGDLDGDGDMDIAAVAASDDKVVWYENTDGLGSYGTEQILTTTADFANRVRITDVDGDGDMDIIATSSEDDKIIWFENLDGAVILVVKSL